MNQTFTRRVRLDRGLTRREKSEKARDYFVRAYGLLERDALKIRTDETNVVTGIFTVDGPRQGVKWTLDYK